ncbi:MAG TPA: ATP-binding cassette domain-containing protein, partial [Acidimicrobiia bacterium]|nr:ATP-binding cassette domain-containing protein [Acidimicrobiia bacterium]
MTTGMDLEVEEVTVRFGGLTAVDSASFHVQPACITGLIGPNGAGKTTLFNVITGLQVPTGGRILLDGSDITHKRPYRRARIGIARTFQRLEPFGSLSARENVMVAMEMARRYAKPERLAASTADGFLELVGIAAVAEEKVESLPTGTARLVELARALATGPSVLLLDEPSSGLDEAETDALGVLLHRLAKDGLAVLL